MCRTEGNVHWPVRWWPSDVVLGTLHQEFAPSEVHLVQWIQRGLVLVSVVAGVTAVWWSWQVGSVEDLAISYEQAQARTESLSSTFKAKMQQDQLSFSPEQIAQIREEVAFANQLSDKRSFSWTRLLNDIEETLPPHVALGSIKLNDHESIIVMEGAAERLQDINAFIQHLQGHHSFHQAVLDKHEIQQDASGGRGGDSEIGEGASPSRHQYLEFRLAVRYRPLL